MLFGRAQQETAALEAAGVAYAVVPRITAALAAAAQIGTSLTQRGSVRAVTFATPRVGEGEDASRWLDAFSAADAGAIYMGMQEAGAIAQALIAAGRAPATPVAIVENASLADARTLPR
jgi:uroporphyrin-III C-methyltransferase